MRLKKYLIESFINKGSWYDVMTSFLPAMDEELSEFEIQMLPDDIFINESKLTIYEHKILLTDVLLEKLLSNRRKNIKNILNNKVLPNHVFTKSFEKLFKRTYEFTFGKTIGQLWLKPKGIKVSVFLQKVEENLIGMFEKFKSADITDLESIKKNLGSKVYVHASYDKHYIGDIIKPYWDPTRYSKGAIGGYVIEGMENYFEELRPASKPSRLKSAFAFLEIEDAIGTFGKYGVSHPRHIYLVTVLGKTHIADMNIIDEFESEASDENLADFDSIEYEEFEKEQDQRLEKLVREYWDGKKGYFKPKWEIIASEGLKVVYSPFRNKEE